MRAVLSSFRISLSICRNVKIIVVLALEEVLFYSSDRQFAWINVHLDTMSMLKALNA